MRFRPFVVYLRLCGMSGIGALLGLAVVGLAGLLLGWAQPDPIWLTGMPVLALAGAVFGLVATALTRFWLAPDVPHRTLSGSVIGAVAAPLACVNPYGQPPLVFAVAVVLLSVGFFTVLWVRGFRRETALVRQQWRTR